MKWISLLFSSALLFACSGQQQAQEELEVDQGYEQGKGGDYGQDDAAEGNGQEETVESSDQENYADDYSENAYGEQMNATLGNDTQASEADYSNYGEGAQYASDNSQNSYSGAELSDETLSDYSNTTTAIENVPTDYSDASAAPAVSGNLAPVAGGRVRYVPVGGVQIYNGPNGQPVGSLGQGEHPITWEEGGWLKITDGMYVPAGSLSDEGVGRPASAAW